MRKRLVLLGLGIVLCLFVAGSSPAGAEVSERVLIHCQGRCEIDADVQGLGGTVTRVYDNIDACAVDIPRSAINELGNLPSVVQLFKDGQIDVPEPQQTATLESVEDAVVFDPQELPGWLDELPDNFNFNNALTGAATLHAEGQLGSGVVVGVIDTGTANNPAVVPALAGSVIGGESFLTPEQDPLSATSTLNQAHGTWIASMVAAHTGFLLPTASYEVQVLLEHAPDSVIHCESSGLPPEQCPPGASIVPMIGTAPAAGIYALKIFSASGYSTYSLLLAAMDRAITLRRNFNEGVPSVPLDPGCGAEENPCVYDSLPIGVVNISLGWPTLFAGRELRDQLTLEMLEVGIVPVASAGNDGPTALTGHPPGISPGSLAVAAASTAAHLRILLDFAYGSGFGYLVRPFDGLQTADFSSRGPTADGRMVPDLAANGVASFVQGPTGAVDFINGTSPASPTVAGAAALLREAFPEVEAVRIRNALPQSANPDLFADGSSVLDRGAGFLDIPAAKALLDAGAVDPELPVGASTPLVEVNIAPLGLRPVKFTHQQYSTHVADLLPGQVAHFLVRSPKDAERLVVSLENVTPELPPEQQNALIGDGIALYVADAPTSFDVLRVAEWVAAEATFVVDQPQSGLLRVAVQGGISNAGRVSCDLRLERERSPLKGRTAFGALLEGEEEVVRFEVPTGTAELSLRLDWVHHWGFYPTSDIDFYLEDPQGTEIPGGASGASPERMLINDPLPGIWSARIHAFQIHEEGQFFDREPWELRVYADGVKLRELR
ncbi:MAG: S8 family serine peptidase [bacterium]|nr:S8 family serine peptidase [bacterium]